MATATRQPAAHVSASRTETEIAAFTGRRSPLVLWHLLSFDAPTVAGLWTWFIARANHVALPLSSVVAMVIAVWMLYAADRLMDARRIRSRGHEDGFEELEARHYFHHFYYTRFLAGIVFASAVLTVLLLRLDMRAIHLYFVLGALLAGYFILIHAAHRGAAQRLPKEIAVGIFFAAATFIPTVARRSDLRMVLLPSALLFAALCSLNCLFIYRWEHTIPRAGREAHFATRLALRYLSWVCGGIVVAALILTMEMHASWPVSLACGAAAFFLFLLHKSRRKIDPVSLRAAADLALLTPLLLWPFLS